MSEWKQIGTLMCGLTNSFAWVEQITNVLQSHEIRVRKESIDLKIKMVYIIYEMQFLTTAIVETTLFVFGYEIKSEKMQWRFWMYYFWH